MKCPECGGDLKLFARKGLKVHKVTKEKLREALYRCTICKRFEKVYLRIKK